MENAVKQVLQKCTVDGMIVKLPEGQLERSLYMQVAKALEGIGGKWKGGKIPVDPTENLDRIAGGEKVNLKKDFQFFATPSRIAERLVNLAEVKLSHAVLEPSAGGGAIIEAITKVQPNLSVDCYEAMDINRVFLEKITNANLIGEDFLKAPADKKYDRIIANPPFTKNQDIDHLYKMYDLLKDGGRVVCITSTHWRHSTNKKETEFRTWLQNKHAALTELEPGTFKESGTMTPAMIIVINKEKGKK